MGSRSSSHNNTVMGNWQYAYLTCRKGKARRKCIVGKNTVPPHRYNTNTLLAQNRPSHWRPFTHPSLFYILVIIQLRGYMPIAHLYLFVFSVCLGIALCVFLALAIIRFFQRSRNIHKPFPHIAALAIAILLAFVFFVLYMSW